MRDTFCFDAEFNGVFRAVCGWAAFSGVDAGIRFRWNVQRRRGRRRLVSRTVGGVGSERSGNCGVSGEIIDVLWKNLASVENAEAFALFLKRVDGALNRALDAELRPGLTYWNGAETASSEADFDRFWERATEAFDRAASANWGTSIEMAALPCVGANPSRTGRTGRRVSNFGARFVGKRRVRRIGRRS